MNILQECNGLLILSKDLHQPTTRLLVAISTFRDYNILFKMLYNIPPTLVKSYIYIKYYHAMSLSSVMRPFIKGIQSWLKECDLKTPIIHIQEFSGPRKNKYCRVFHTPVKDLKDLSLLGKIKKIYLRCNGSCQKKGFDLLAKQIPTQWPTQMKSSLLFYNL